MEVIKNWFRREMLLLLVLYLGFALFYMTALNWSFPSEYQGSYSWRIVYLDYPLKALFTLPVWYLTFRTFRSWSLPAKLLLNLALLPVWVKGWQLSYYWICDNLLDGNHLQGNAQWWDIYIPGLFYFLQFGIFHAWAYYQDLRRTELARAESERLALTSELSALKAQLNPHFLYNAFNAISASTGPGQERTRDMIAQLSDLFRYQLRANQAETLPLGSELEFVEGYLILERARFGDRLRYRIEVERPELRNAALPPLLLQPLVENAVRHGISPLVAGGTVTVSVSEIGGELILAVVDNGHGFDPAAAKRGYGLTNTQRRLALLYRESLTINSAPGGGTECRFRLPFTPSDPPRHRMSKTSDVDRHSVRPRRSDKLSAPSISFRS
jgi:signal transduction histidine kinase